MPALHIRRIDDAVVAALKQRAARNHRSLEAELRCILRDVAFGDAASTSGRRTLRLTTVDVNPASDFSRADLYDDADR